MANEENLKVPTTSQARERGKKGGKASARKRKERKLIKEQMGLLLSLPIESEDTKEILKKAGVPENEMNNQMAMVVSMFQNTLKGNNSAVSAFNSIMGLMGENPTNKIELETIDKTAIEDIEEFMNEECKIQKEEKD